MHRCLELAKLGSGNVAPNPMVGAVMVCNDQIIGEGYHQKYGEAHAEPNCIRHAIENGHSDLISRSTLYVSLEPCVHFGKTPPCADLIIRNKIPNSTSIPAFFNFSIPFPSTSLKGSQQPTTTFGILFLMIRSAQGGVFPK